MYTALDLHEEILAACRDHRVAEHTLARLLARMKAERLYLELGFASVHDYAREQLDLEPRKTRALLQLGASMPDLPALDHAFGDGEIGWTKAREILRVATAENVEAWVERARLVNSRELEHQVERARIGEQPPAGPDLARAPARKRVVFEMEAADAEVLRQALAVCRQQTDNASVDDGVLLGMLATRLLHDAAATEAPTGPGYRRVVVVCPHCRHTTGVDAEASGTIAAESGCDREEVDLTDGPNRGRVTRSIRPKVRQAVLARDRYRCQVPGCSCRIWSHLHHIEERQHGGAHAEDNLLTLCSAHHRQVHDGLLGIWRDASGDVVFTFPDGRLVVRGPRGPKVTFGPQYVEQGPLHGGLSSDVADRDLELARGSSGARTAGGPRPTKSLPA